MGVKETKSFLHSMKKLTTSNQVDEHVSISFNEAILRSYDTVTPFHNPERKTEQ